MIITCPNCQTSYQVADNAIGSAGRKVQCAHCRESWQAKPEKEPERPKPKLVKPEKEPAPVSDEEEAALDAVFKKAAEMGAERPGGDAAEGETEPAEARGEADHALRAMQQKAMRKRHIQIAKRLPMGRIRSNVRLVGVCVLTAVLTGLFAFRTEVVLLMPDLAGVYESIGLPVNVAGLEFTDVQTVKALRNGMEVMLISGRIRNVTGRQVNVRPVVVSILDKDGASLYSWSVTPVVRMAGPGESVQFETQLNSAPEGAETVRLAFADGRAK